jgi:hypothetical protein
MKANTVDDQRTETVRAASATRLFNLPNEQCRAELQVDGLHFDD